MNPAYVPVLVYLSPIGISFQWMTGALPDSESDYSVPFPGVLCPVDNHDTL